MNKKLILYRRSQSGVALFISLVLLLVLTILGVSAVQTTSLELRMARNDHDRILAFQAAESALRDAELAVEAVGSVDEFTSAGTSGKWTVAAFGTPERWQVASAWTGAGSVVSANSVSGVSQQPRFLIERAASILREENGYAIEDDFGNSASGADTIEIFRITALGFGGSVNSSVMLQSTYGRVLD